MRMGDQLLQRYENVRLHSKPFPESTVSRLIDRFKSTGSVDDKARSGRPSLDNDTTEKVRESAVRLKQENFSGSTSARQIANEVGTNSTVHKILRTRLNLVG